MTNCILCGGSMTARFSCRDYTQPDSSTEFTLMWCDACSFGRLAGDFTPQQVSEFYAENYYTHRKPKAVPRKGLIDKLFQSVAWRLDNGAHLNPSEAGSPRSFCDVGCGSGHQIESFKAAGFDVVGIEQDTEAMKIAATMAPIYYGTAEHLPSEVSGRKFGVVLLLHVLEHCIDPIAAMKNVRSILADDGLAIVEVPNNDALGFTSFEASWPWADIPRHLNFFTERSLDALLRHCGIERTKTRFAGFTRQFSPEWRDQFYEIARVLKPGISYYQQAALLLANCMRSPDSKRYDSVRMHGHRS